MRRNHLNKMESKRSGLLFFFFFFYVTKATDIGNDCGADCGVFNPSGGWRTRPVVVTFAINLSSLRRNVTSGQTF